jgi:hypothetical protein
MKRSSNIESDSEDTSSSSSDEDEEDDKKKKACTSCPGLHERIVELCSRIVSLEADLKVPIPTSCSTCELHAMKNLDLAKRVGRLQDENDKLREVLSWLSSQEPQLGMMIASYTRFDS